jgi:hypothetical protein
LSDMLRDGPRHLLARGGGAELGPVTLGISEGASLRLSRGDQLDYEGRQMTMSGMNDEEDESCHLHLSRELRW